MQITDFYKTKVGRIALFVDGAFLLSMHPDVFAASGLSIGSQVDEESLQELAAEAELKKAKEKAMQLLSYKEYTANELKTRLQRQSGEEAAEAATRRMEELGLLNDADYARRFARELAQRRRFGIYRVRQEMRRKGLDSELIEDAIAQLDEQDPVEQIRALLEKKYPAAWEDEQVKRRAFAAMVRLGHSSTDIRRALGRDEQFD